MPEDFLIPSGGGDGVVQWQERGYGAIVNDSYADETPSYTLSRGENRTFLCFLLWEVQKKDLFFVEQILFEFLEPENFRTLR